MNVSPKVLQRATKTPIKKVNFQKKNQIIKNNGESKNNIVSIVINELNKLDEEEIKSSFNSVFINQTNEQTTILTGLISKINEVKKSITEKLKDNKKNLNPLNNSSSFSKEINNNNNNEKINIIQNDLKTLLKNSKIKFKQFYDCITSNINNTLNQLNDYIIQDKQNLAIDKLNHFDKIISELSSIVNGIENIQTKTIENILNNNNLKTQNLSFSKSPIKINTFDVHQNLKKNTSFIRYSTHTKNISNFNSNMKRNINETMLNKSINNISSDNNNILNKSTLISNNHTSQVNALKGKLKEKNAEIEKLKGLLSKEKESKLSFMDELNKMKFNNIGKNTVNKNNKIITFKSKASDSNYTNLNTKLSKLTEMIISFSYSMNNLRDSINKSSISNTESKNLYVKLRNKLIDLVNETSQIKNSLINKNENKKEEDLMKDLSQDIKEDNKLMDIKQQKNQNNLNNKFFSFRNGDITSSYSIRENEGHTNNIFNNNITLTTLSNYNIDALLAENKSLKSQLASQILLSNSQKKNNELSTSNSSRNENELIKEINNLKNEIKEKNFEIEQIKLTCGNNNDNQLFKNLKETYNTNLKNIKDTYEILIEEKNKKIEELNEENINFEKELENLKSSLMKINNDNRKKNILNEATINKLENEKKRLTLKYENINEINDKTINDNNDINDYKLVIEKLNKEIEEKNNYIELITQNHKNDLNELNSLIIDLKSKIAVLQEENDYLTLSQRSLKDK